jgi:hypothetical protein
LRLEAQKSKDEVRRLQIDNQNYKERYQTTGCSCGLEKKVEDLNKQISDLKLTQKVVVCHNQEIGSYEYIGQPHNLNNQPARNIQDLLQSLKQRLNDGHNKRLTVNTIFRACDKRHASTLEKQELQ